MQGVCKALPTLIRQEEAMKAQAILAILVRVAGGVALAVQTPINAALPRF